MSDDIIVRLKAVEAAEMDVANSCDLPPNLTANWEYAMAVRDGIAELAALRARVAELEAALGELVRLKALKESRYALACLEVTDAERAEVRANLAEYREKKEAAWDAARAAMRLAGNKEAQRK